MHSTGDEFITDQKIIDSVKKYLVRFFHEGKVSGFPILSKIDHNIATQIWITACQFIEKQLESDKAVTVSQLGTFSFSSKRLDIGNNKFIIVQRPVFLLAERLAQTHGITFTKHHVSGSIPVVKMNFTSIAISSGHDRDLVESLIREILQALSRVIAYRDPVEFPFYNIGYLVVRDFKARCKFNPGFIKKMDGTGELSKILESKKNKKKQLQRAKTTLDDPNDSFELARLPDIGDHKIEAKVGDIPTAGLCGFESIKNETVAKKSQTRVMSPPEKKQRPQTTVLPEVLENLNYVAFQRKKIEEEKKRREAEADACLQKYQDDKDRRQMEIEQEEKLQKLERAREVAAFNLRTAFAEKESNLLSTKESQAKAYIFKNRPLTPARFKKQSEYSAALGEQVDMKTKMKHQRRTEREHAEREEQYNLAKEIQDHAQQKHDTSRKNRKAYRRALSSQLKVKQEIERMVNDQEELAEPSIPTVPYFGRNHMNPQKPVDDRARARALFKAQLAMASEKRKEAIKQHLANQNSESAVLRRTKTDLLNDQARQYEDAVNRRRLLESNWIKHAQEKHAKERDHEKFMANERTLQEKEAELHDNYQYLFKPKPTGYHSGRFKSNIWRESRYIPGSRLMV